MRWRADVTIRILTLLVLWVSPLSLFAQTPKPPSLKEQLEAQYAPGTVLVIQKAGILGVPPASTRMCAAKYQDGNLKPPDVSCSAPLKNSSRPFPVGEKVNPSEIRVNLPLEEISFGVIECDSCNKGNPSSPYKAQVDFQFAKGYLEKGRVSEIEDTISQLLSLEEGADQQSQPAQNGGDVLTNSDVVKMVKAKLGDGIIISTVRSSACNFDTSVNGMVKLKEAGVSDPVIQAMRDAQDASNAAANDQGPAPTSDTQSAKPEGPPPVPGQLSFSVKHRHSVFWNPGTSDVEYYCSGTLSVTPDGTVAYECTQTDDPSGRCEHLSFAPGSLKQVKIGLAGNLHLASKTQGNFDFYGNRNDIKQAQAAIAPLIQK
jgi:hypothetical protein